MKIRVIIFSIILLVGISIAGIINLNYFSDNPDSVYNRSENNRLKVYNPIDINPSLVDSSLHEKTTDHTINDFEFLNQLGDTIRKSNVNGKIYVTNFFFTTCGGICPKMTRQLQRVQEEFKDDDHFLILSHTVNPKIDSVEVMARYANRFEADANKWWFLTGSKEDLYIMARKSYLVVPDKADPNFDHGDESDFIHTENFVLIDPKGQIRGMYDGTMPEEVAELIRDVYDLKKEFDLN